MTWTRKSLTQTSGWFNQKPLAPLDETLRFPLALEEILKLLKKEYGISPKKKPLIAHNGYFYFQPYKAYFFQIIFQLGAYRLLWRLVRETKMAKEEWNKDVERFLKEFNQLKRQDLTKLNNQELLEQIERTIKFDAFWLLKLGFGPSLTYHYLFEIFLKSLYRLLVKDEYPQNYHELVAGYPSKLKEADLAFWLVAKGKISLDDYLEQYGFRATDVSLVIPTIGEDRGEFRKQIDAFKNITIPDFGQKSQQVLEKRRLREKYVAENFRFWVPFGKATFNWVLKIARDYISVRESRKFYYTKPTFLIRKSLLELGKRLECLKDPEEVFFLTKNELKKAVLDSKGINKRRMQAEVGKRKKQWEERSEEIPAEEIEI